MLQRGGGHHTDTQRSPAAIGRGLLLFVAQGRRAPHGHPEVASRYREGAATIWGCYYCCREEAEEEKEERAGLR